MVLVAQDPWEPEPRQDTAVDEVGYDGDSLAFERQDKQPDGVGDRFVLIAALAAKCGLGVGAGRHQPVAAPSAPGLYLPQEAWNGHRSLVLEWRGWRCDPGVVGEERDDPVDVVGNPSLRESPYELSFARRVGLGGSPATSRPVNMLEGCSRPFQCALHALFAAVEHVRDLGGPEAQHVAEQKRSPLAGRKLLQRGNEEARNGEREEDAALGSLQRPESACGLEEHRAEAP